MSTNTKPDNIVHEAPGVLVWTEGEVYHATLDGQDVTELRMTMADVMKAGHCVSGASVWFESLGVDFRTFVREGELAPIFLRKGDAYAVSVIRKKLERENGRNT